MTGCNEESKESEKNYLISHYDKEKQDLLNHLPEWLKVLRDFYFKYKIKE